MPHTPKLNAARRLFLILVWGLLTQNAFSREPQAEPIPLHGMISGVTDGDTVTLLDAQNMRYKLRLAGIDAPEMRMPFGVQAKQFLEKRLLNKKVVALITKQDRYGRDIATLLLAGEDINLQLIQAGLAWHYTKYAREQTDESAARYSNAERKARMQSVGLWQADSPQSPWDWRADRKRKNWEAKYAASATGIRVGSY
ncbi:MAG: thermonuclease family protein [Candidatus Saccharibacteria bacterium]|nr:thermonuclease family protein [Rhodoferax sp.]